MDAKQVAEIIDKCPTTPHLVQYAREVLLGAGFQELKETENWSDIPQKFFVTRDDRQIIAINKKDFSKGFFVASQGDAPCFKAKPNSKGSGANCIQVRIAPYGNANFYLFFDHDLKAAGRVYHTVDGKVKSTLFETELPIAIIPSLAIHMDRSAAVKSEVNLETDMNPVLEIDNGEQQVSQEHSDALLKAIADAAHIKVEDIIDFEVSFVDAQPTELTGIDKKLLNGPRIAQITGAIEAVNALANAKDPENGLLGLVIYDNQVIGGNTRCGVKSNFLKNTLDRINCPADFYHRTLVLALNPINAVNPNSSGSFPAVAARNGVYTLFNPSLMSDVELGSFCVANEFASSKNHALAESPNAAQNQALGSELATQLALRVVDIGIPVLSVNSERQIAFVDDINELSSLLTDFYNDYLQSSPGFVTA